MNNHVPSIALCRNLTNGELVQALAHRNPVTEPLLAEICKRFTTLVDENEVLSDVLVDMLKPCGVR